MRRKEPSEIAKKLTDLILLSLVVMIGPVRQEVLSGISDKNTFVKLREKLAAFDNFAIDTKDYETAAEFYNICRKNDVQGSHTDFLICAVAYNNNFLIYTTDKDFYNFMKHLPIKILNSD